MLGNRLRPGDSYVRCGVPANAGAGPPGLLAKLDSGDLMLLLLLILLYRESRDEDFLIILAVVVMSILNEK